MPVFVSAISVFILSSPPLCAHASPIASADLVPGLCEDLLSSIDQPLKIKRDADAGREYLLCDYNRDGDSYRSPWSNAYDPPLDDGQVPSASLRQLEVQANAAFDTYRKMYFEGGISSVYLWDLEGESFAGVVLIKKLGDGGNRIKGCWDSVHVFEVNVQSADSAHYRLTSTVMLWLQTNKEGSGVMQLGGSMTRQVRVRAVAGRAQVRGSGASGGASGSGASGSERK